WTSIPPDHTHVRGCWERVGKKISLIYANQLRQGTVEQNGKTYPIPPEKIYCPWKEEGSEPHLLGDELYFTELQANEVLCIKYTPGAWKKEEAEQIKRALEILLQQGGQQQNLSYWEAMTLKRCCDAVCRIAINNAKVENQLTDVWGTGFV